MRQLHFAGVEQKETVKHALVGFGLLPQLFSETGPLVQVALDLGLLIGLNQFALLQRDRLIQICNFHGQNAPRLIRMTLSLLRLIDFNKFLVVQVVVRFDRVV